MENVLTIAGSDSLAGGGLQADLKTFQELETFGVSAVTSIATVLPDDFTVTPLSPDLIASQLKSVLTQVPLSAIKTGLLPDLATLRVVVTALRQQTVPIIVDPVLVFKEGKTATQAAYIAALKQELLPLATVVTPNLKEAELLSGLTLTSAEQLPAAARRIQALGCPNVVIKGGSRLAGDTAVDYLFTPQGETWFRALKVASPATDGAGCTFSAAITAWLARGVPVTAAVDRAKAFVRAGIVYGVQFNDQFGSVWQGAWRRYGGNQRAKS
ncbi:bifunctional hydroxymethylpyrimidine kinase/phosphomethylpyrimidine kinase [Levilactobacillus zymae]|uniref:bifunctional hydroxymethylpyrimidine kinase/phosphomethylpyrimidine kinase n=1 Tax=Levilactobacillus zymae TaxID=267363 RepID=UPI0028B804E6|nr:bifunctional hydroxymethylpyrimidine kinase/phosphomethylpyrimidine kinase [Levilactobacillus zymae]MDT6979582.1 bifunctional hydroxymethylpyrimidine kinase/phosphomethylpyrimidine kinase [Levilactobacillus zymae]